MIRPSRARFLIEAEPEPLALSLPLPTGDVFELYRRIALPGRPSFLLESGKGSQAIARYSFLGSDPYLMVTGKDGRCELRGRDRTTLHEQDPFLALTALMRESRMPRPEGLPPFFGGAVGYCGYDLARRFETLPSSAVDVEAWPDLQFAFVDLLAAVDHRTDTLHLIFTPPRDRLVGEPREKLYQEGCDRLAELEARLTAPPAGGQPGYPPGPRFGPIDLRPDLPRGAYLDRVTECQEYIAAGDIYQANLSHRFSLTFGQTDTGGWNGRASALYARLRRVNPAPFAALLDFGEIGLVSSSPERLVRLCGRRAETRPIAGTRPRGGGLSEDRRLAEDLLMNPKERAEHLMLVDLARNDLGRVCRYGTVRTEEFMVVERYSHVSHLVSNVAGELRDGLDGFDLLRAVFPGGTITGVPKIRCMQIIDSLEPVRRGPYTGSLGYLSWSGDLDLNIVIRTLALKGGRGFVQVGAGIVADSDPAREYEETLYKAEALIEALKER
jgi:para-aminobenzoate synthetase component 1